MSVIHRVLACILLLLLWRNEAGAAPSGRERRESKSEAQQNFDPISNNDRINHFGQNSNFGSLQQQRTFQNQQLQIQSQQQQFQQGQPQPFQLSSQQSPAAFPDVFNSNQPQFQQQQNQPFQQQIPQQRPPFQPQQGFPSSRAQSNQFGGVPQSIPLPLNSGPGSGSSLYDQIVNKINSGHRQKSQRKQQVIQQRPRNPFSDPTVAVSPQRNQPVPNIPSVNPILPNPTTPSIQQSSLPRRGQTQNLPQVVNANQQSSPNLGLALFGNRNSNQFEQSSQRSVQTLFPTEPAVPNIDFLELQRKQEIEEQRQKEIEIQRLKAIEEQRLKRIEEERIKKAEEIRLKEIEEERIRKIKEQQLEQERLQKLEEQRLEEERIQKIKEKKLEEERLRLIEQKKIEEQKAKAEEEKRQKALEQKRLKEIEEQKRIQRIKEEEEEKKKEIERQQRKEAEEKRIKQLEEQRKKERQRQRELEEEKKRVIEQQIRDKKKKEEQRLQQIRDKENEQS